MGIKIYHSGSFDRTFDFLEKAKSPDKFHFLDTFGAQGVAALSAATPILTGATANSWYYVIKESKNSVAISWHNSEPAGSTPLAVILQYGHGTKNGGYVEGIDYINPAIQPIFDDITSNAWDALTKKGV